MSTAMAEPRTLADALDDGCQTCGYPVIQYIGHELLDDGYEGEHAEWCVRGVYRPNSDLEGIRVRCPLCSHLWRTNAEVTEHLARSHRRG